jgi:ABC-type multidrug transport system fused ATPase/permease subunit
MEKKITELYKKEGSIGKCVKKLYMGLIIKNFLLMGLCQGFLCSMSIVMYKIIVEAQTNNDTDERNKNLIILFSVLCALQILGSILKNYIACDLSRLSVRLKCGVIFAVYKKVLNISILNPSQHTESNVLNYMNVDAQKLEDAITKLSLLLEAFWLILYGFSICVWLISYNIAACFVSFFGLTLLTMSLYKLIFKYEVMVAIAKDKRTQLLKNIINNVKYIKTRVWENFYHSKIYQSREAELAAIDKSNFVFVVIVALAWYNPTISYLSTYASMLIFNLKFDVAIILAYVRIFSTILKGMGYIPTVVQFFIELKVSLDRINTYLDTDELDFSWIVQTKSNPETFPREKDNQPFAIEMDLGNFYWNKMDEKLMKERREKARRKRVAIRKMKFDGTATNDANLFLENGNENQSIRTVSYQNSYMTKSTMQGSLAKTSNPTLTQSLMSGASNEKLGFQIMDIDMLIPKGELVMIVGEIGSGKSSLFQAIMNEMAMKFQNPMPQLKLNGELFYVSQNPWLLNMTIKDNIILDKPYNQKKFEFAVKYSALDSDLRLFDEKEMRLITDGASNLSGGQRTRITLARALYQE